MNENYEATIAKRNILATIAMVLTCTSFIGLVSTYIIMTWNLGITTTNDFDPVPIPDQYVNKVISVLVVGAAWFYYRLNWLSRRGDSFTPSIICILLLMLGVVNILVYGSMRARYVPGDEWLIPQDPLLDSFVQLWASWAAGPAIMFICFLIWHLIYCPAVERLNPPKKQKKRKRRGQNYTTQRLSPPTYQTYNPHQQSRRPGRHQR